MARAPEKGTKREELPLEGLLGVVAAVPVTPTVQRAGLGPGCLKADKDKHCSSTLLWGRNKLIEKEVRFFVVPGVGWGLGKWVKTVQIWTSSYKAN